MSGKDFYYIGEYKKALFLFRYELKKCTNTVEKIDSLFHMGSCYYQLNNPQKAISYYNHVANLTEKIKYSNEVMAVLTLAMSYGQLGLIYKNQLLDLKKAKTYFKYALDFSLKYKKLSDDDSFQGDYMCKNLLESKV